MSRILVTGGAGFIASELAGRLANNPDNKIVIVDNLITGSTENIPDSSYNNIHFIKADVNNFDDISSIFYNYGFDYVFHYAATVGVERTLNHPLKVLQDIKGIKNILNLSKNTNVKRIFFSSSSEVYGEPVDIPHSEDKIPLNSRLPYAIVKTLGEAFLKTYQREFGLAYTIFRIFNTYGAKQSTDFVIPKFIHAALRNEDITIYGDGSQTRTFCYIEDTIEASINAFYKHQYINDVINVGSDKEIQVIELANLIKEVTGSKSNIVHLPPLNEGEMSRRKPDITKMKDLLNRELIWLPEGLEYVIREPKRVNK
jgi:UDP-glucose 4-epimerase